MSLLYVTAQQACLPSEADLVPATLQIDLKSGTITAVLPRYVAPHQRAQVDQGEPEAEWIDVGDQVLLPGLVDSHVRLCFCLSRVLISCG